MSTMMQWVWRCTAFSVHDAMPLFTRCCARSAESAKHDANPRSKSLLQPGVELEMIVPLETTAEVKTVCLQLAALTAIALIWKLATPRKSFQLSWFLTALLLYVFYDGMLTRGFYLLPSWPGQSIWNWSGKSLSLAAMSVVALTPWFGARQVGLSPSSGSAGTRAPIVATILFGGFFLILGIVDGFPRSDWETILFQWTLPGLDEELFYRGVLRFAMNEAFRNRSIIAGAPLGFDGILSSILFGFAHALDYSEYVRFDTMVFATTAIPSLFLLWLRERSGSLLLPVVAHNLANGLPTLL